MIAIEGTSKTSLKCLTPRPHVDGWKQLTDHQIARVVSKGQAGSLAFIHRYYMGESPWTSTQEHRSSARTICPESHCEHKQAT